MNLPNRITATRLFLTIVVIILILVPFTFFGINFPKYDINGVTIELNYIIAGIIFMIASLTDFLDGHIARKYNMVTDTGKMLDAIADKVLVSPILIILAYNGFIPVTIPVVYITRDIIVDAVKMQVASKGKVVAAIKTGKIKTACMMVGLVFTFFYNIPFEFINIRVDLFLLYFACIMAVVSCIEYFVLNKDILFKKTEII